MVIPVNEKLMVWGFPTDILSTQNDAPDFLPPVLSNVPFTKMKRNAELVTGIVVDTNCHPDAEVPV